MEAYAKAQGLWIDETSEDPVFSDILELDMATVVPSIAGPKRPQDKVELTVAAPAFETALTEVFNRPVDAPRVKVEGEKFDLGDGDVVIAAITSCTNTSNPSVLIAAGLVARKAKKLGLSVKPWVKTSLAPGSQVVTDYLTAAGLQADLDAMGFNLVGYGCTTCIGNSGPLSDSISKAINDNGLVGASVLSGNRNFEGRVNPDVQANYLASPPLVVAYALAGSMRIDISKDPIGQDEKGKDVFLKDVWPTSKEIADIQKKCVTPAMFAKRYADVFKGDKHWQGNGDVFKGDKHWQAIKVEGGQTYAWDIGSTYVKNPPYFEGMSMTPSAVKDIIEARVLGVFGDSITTDHISPAGSIKKTSPAGAWLTNRGVDALDFNSYGARRGHHEVMMRGTFANIRIRNKITPDIMRYQSEGRPLVVFAGKEYGTGSSRDWAAKGTRLLGVRAVLAESYERIHRSNLVGMGVVPLQFKAEGWSKLGLTGEEIVTIRGLSDVNVGKLRPRQDLWVELFRPSDGKMARFPVRCRIDNQTELDYFKAGGVMPYVLRNLARGTAE
ncbi:MAG: aconitate hydratase 1 [bacterium]|nr:MAG: aconitate hydratase 1 [bacterium]